MTQSTRPDAVAGPVLGPADEQRRAGLRRMRLVATGLLGLAAVIFVLTLDRDGFATFSVDIAAYYSRTSGVVDLGLFSVLIDGVVLDSFDFGGANGGPLTLRNTLDFTTRLAAGDHTISLQATRLFAPARGVYTQFFDNASLDVTAVPEPATWALMIAGFGLAGASLRRRAALG